jgi:hypothetical protein
MRRLLTIFILLFISSTYLYSQTKGEPPKSPTGYKPDSVFVFTPKRPLISDAVTNDLQNAWGIDLLLSNNGFGAGFFMQLKLSDAIVAYGSLYISGARNSDELEQPFYDEYGQIVYRVPGKINRLYMFPLTFGMQYYIFRDVLSESLKPYLSFGVGPTFILSTPYEIEFFSAFSHASFYTRFGTSVGIGADVGGSEKTTMSVNMKYYFIPFGSPGLESMQGSPITNFGGIFLSLSVAMKY